MNWMPHRLFDSGAPGTTPSNPMTTSRHREALLERHLNDLLGEIAPLARDYLQRQVQWVELPGGAVLMEEGQAGDSAYLVLSGRLRIYARSDENTARMVREVARGEVVGEMSLFTGEPRSATVVAVRDSLLARLDKQGFDGLLALGPQVSAALTRLIIRRLQTQHERRPLPPPVTVALLPISEGVDGAGFAAELAGALQKYGRVTILDQCAIDMALGREGAESRPGVDFDHAIAGVIDTLEAENDFVLLVSDGTVGGWTRCCVRHGDELLLLADATQAPAVHPVERDCLSERAGRSEAAEILVLLHPSATPIPRGTRHWLARRPLTAHVHLRAGLSRDTARLARLLARTAVGLVLAGGGARGFAHLGVWRAMKSCGVEIDCVGGTSIGAVMAALVAADQPVERSIDVARRTFKKNPTGDFNWLPLVSLMRGRRVRTAISGALGELLGGQADVEDLWKSFFCIASNYSQAREQQIASGDLTQALLASVAIPGALPPIVRDGDLLCDGGTFNNFPVDVMRATRGIGTVAGVEIAVRRARKVEFDQVPGGFALLRDRLRARHKRRFRLPSLTSYLLNVTILYSMSQSQQARRQTDVFFAPPLERIGLLQWSRFDEIVRQGHDHAVEVLAALEAERRGALGLSG
jgi:NTE family protein